MNLLNFAGLKKSLKTNTVNSPSQYCWIAIYLLFTSCSTNYNIQTNDAHIFIDQNKTKYYVNENLKFSAELSYNDFNYNVQPVVNQREKRILKKIGFDSKKDTILYAGRGSLLILKNNNVDLRKFRIINLYDSAFMRKPQNEWTVNFYRKSYIIPKTKTFIINDLIPYNKKYLQRIEFTETDYNGFIDPTDADDILFFSGEYQEVMRLTKETHLNILLKKTINPKEVYALFSDYFKNEKTLNYRAAYLAESYGRNYYKPQERGFFDQMLATYYAFANDMKKSDMVWTNLMKKDTSDTTRLKVIGQLEDLLKLTKNQQVVMFNEAHNSPNHRLLIDKLLDTLYNQGFRYLAVEAFYSDSLFSKTGFLSFDNGFYLCEPNFANLVRNAYKKGWNIISYDDFYSGNREKAQAENIYNRTIKQDSTAKVIVLAGHGHIDSTKMAGIFAHISGIKPLTIDQTVSYYTNLGKSKNNTVTIVEIKQSSPKADLYLNNELINNNINTRAQTISILDTDCKMLCVYDEIEYNFMLQTNKYPLPTAVYSIEKEKTINLNLSQGKYKILYLNYFGCVINERTLLVE